MFLVGCFLLVIVKVVSSVAVYVTLESAKVVGDYIDISIRFQSCVPRRNQSHTGQYVVYAVVMTVVQ